MNRLSGIFLAALPLLAFPVCAFAGGSFGESAPDFPPGVFSDGGHYQVSDFQGKVLVLFFFESECPKCKGLIPERNKVVAKFKDMPVKFIAVGPHNSLTDVRAYIGETKLAMPVFADTFNIMETLYSQKISLQNIYQFRVVGADGKVVAYDMTPAEIDKALANIKWKYKDKGFDPRLNGIIDMLEWNQYEPAMKQLSPLRKAQSKSLAEAAEKLYQAVRTEGEAWKTQADQLATDQPAAAYDLYLKISTTFTGDELAKSIIDPLKTLRANKAVTDELAARQQYAQLYTAIPKAQLQQRDQIAKFCENLAAKFPGTPTAAKAKTLAEAIASAPAGN